jgi:2-C-methyl-D-erythritol 4-phosphate cytidylyltransferase
MQPFGGTYHPRVAEPQSTECAGAAVVAAAVVLASGSGSRVGAAVNKVYLPLSGRRVVGWSLTTLARVPGVGVTVLVIRPQDRTLADEVLADAALAGVPVEVVLGGASRQESELMALRQLAGRISTGQIDTVLIHDAARPLVSPELADAVLRAAREFGGAIPGLPRADLVPVTSDTNHATVVGPALDRAVTVQTPQGFAAKPLLDAYLRAAADGFVGTDTAACIARYSDLRTRCIAGDERNIKITYPYDVPIAERLLATNW